MSNLVFYDTLTRRKVTFVPLNAGNVRLYVCGPTVYDYAHIGNARPVVVFDVLYRLLKHIYPTVTYVRNITDVDDKINNRALESGRSIREITDQTTKVFQEDMRAVGALAPDYEPRATEHIPSMIEMIEVLIEKRHAYASEGHVLFSVPSMADYGELSGRNREQQIDGARVDVAPYKRDAADFVLWKPSGSDAPGWESPWGYGRPGWHIECSAMSHMYLGEAFDIHAGGIDLVFPHHENEIAQTRCCFGTSSMANIWMHNGYVSVDGEKMSKSLGNFYTVHDLLSEWPGEVIRYALLAGHYRAPLDYSQKGLSDARAALDRLYQSLRSTEKYHWESIKPASLILDALADDLNTPLALSKLHELARKLNKVRNEDEITRLKSELISSARFLGFLQQEPDMWFKESVSDDAKWSTETIEKSIADREKARLNKHFVEADRIRDELQSNGIILEDGSGGTKWRRN